MHNTTLSVYIASGFCRRNYIAFVWPLSRQVASTRTQSYPNNIMIGMYTTAFLRVVPTSINILRIAEIVL